MNKPIILSNAYKISELIIKIHAEEEKHLDLLKLLKLLYICFGCISAYKNRIDKNNHSYWLFDERIEAWELGPIIPDIYYDVRFYSDYSDNNKITHVVFDKIDSHREIDDDMKSIYRYIKRICEHYFEQKSSDMEKIARNVGSPWYELFDGTPSKEIPKEIIVKYYTDLYKEL